MLQNLTASGVVRKYLVTRCLEQRETLGEPTYRATVERLADALLLVDPEVDLAEWRQFRLDCQIPLTEDVEAADPVY